MDLAFLSRGFVSGLAIAAPVGAIGLLCIRRTLAEGRLVGLVSGLGAATADAFYGTVAAFGVGAVSAALVAHQGWIRWLGGLYLCYLGVRIATSKPATEAVSRTGRGLLPAYLSTVALTLTNPTTILSFAAIFAGVRLGATGPDRVSAGLLVLGVFLGSAAWWLLLITGVGLFRSTLKQHRLVGYGVLSVLSLR